MLRNINELRGFAIRATDGVLGEVVDLYFDDDAWAIRYLVVDTGRWLSGRKVLISPLAIGTVDWIAQEVAVSLTKARVKGSPDVDTRKPVSRQQEAAYFGYYDYPYYWGGSSLWGVGGYPGSLTAERGIEGQETARRTSAAETADSHLRSCDAVQREACRQVYKGGVPAGAVAPGVGLHIDSLGLRCFFQLSRHRHGSCSRRR